MLSPKVWSICPECDRMWRLDGDGCLYCGHSTESDNPGSIVGHGRIMIVNSGPPASAGLPKGVASIDTYPLNWFTHTNGYTFSEIDKILRLELGEIFVQRHQVPAASYYAIISHIKTSNRSGE